MKRIIAVVAAVSMCAVASAQVSTAVKEEGKAAAETSKQVGDQMKASVSSQPQKSVDKGAAHVHKAKAKAHQKAANEATKAVGK